MKPRFTPGPWHHDFLDEYGWVLDENNRYLADIVNSDSEGLLAPPDEQQANAELMAAAPELLEKLRTLAWILSDLHDIPELSMAAGAAAEINEWTNQFYKEETDDTAKD